MINDIVSQTIVKLFESERFYAEIIAQMHRTFSEKVPVAGVRIKNNIELFINPKTFTEYTLKERVAILKHECEHILRDHISRAKELAPEVFVKDKSDEDVVLNNMKHKSLNIAMDCAINHHLANIPKDGVFPKTFSLPDGQTMEWYLENLKDNEKAKSFMEFDDHGIWAESDDDKEIIKEKIRQAINRAASRTRAAGHMSADHELLVSALNKEASVSWQAQIKRFVAKTIETVIDTSRKKRNRRYGLQFPGIIKTELLHLGVAIDTSGSVSDEALTQFMKEIEIISKYAKVTIVEADSEIKNSYTFKAKKEYKISGRGGTAYQPAFDFFNSMKDSIDGLIYFGDMDCFDTEEIKKPKYPVLWAIVGSQEPPAEFGKKVYVKVSGE